jgi:hypothetical protein
LSEFELNHCADAITDVGQELHVLPY